MFNFYVDSLSFDNLVSCSMQIKQTNISIFSPIVGLTVSFAEPLSFVRYRNEAHKKDAMTNLASIYYVIIY